MRISGHCDSVMPDFVTSSRVWVIVYSRMSGEFVGSAEPLCATWKLAPMRLLPGMRSYMPRLVFEPVEGLLTQRAFVGSG